MSIRTFIKSLRCCGRAVRHSSAKAVTLVQIQSAPPYIFKHKRMSKKYPASHYKDEHIIRITAAFIAALTFIILISHWEVGAIFLSVDFGIRAFTSQHSLLSILAKAISNILHLKPKPVFAAPKKFAALLGFIMSTIILTLLHFNLLTGAYIAGGVLIVCALLESLFNICVGCLVYNFIVAPLVNQRQLKN